MENIAEGSRTSEQSVSQISESTNSLAKLANDLQAIVSRFKIDSMEDKKSSSHPSGGSSPISDSMNSTE